MRLVHQGKLSRLMALLLSAFLVAPFLAVTSVVAAPVSQKKTVRHKKTGKAPIQKDAVDKDKKGTASTDEDEEDKDEKKFDPKLPAIPLTSDLMYRILHAELAGH